MRDKSRETWDAIEEISRGFFGKKVRGFCVLRPLVTAQIAWT